MIGSLLGLTLLFSDKPLMFETVQCESNFHQYALDGNLLKGQAGELGLGQFMPTTWYWMNELRGLSLNIADPIDQLNMMRWAFEHGYADLWTCYRQLASGK